MILKYTKSEDLPQTCAFCIKYLPWVKEFQKTKATTFCIIILNMVLNYMMPSQVLDTQDTFKGYLIKEH